ncbi:TetR/AcrR family transcriptional regulator [Desulforudis sp. 1088]|uniref:TetR/AcrR family transcriptional regulator n=1 Tax=unclassified Candidatus Desulforudis TaxID=2635950 RepID=UPI00346972E3
MPARQRDPVASRQRILNAAREVFAEVGFEAARVDEIARRADINKRMLYHYFGGKEDLYIEVLRQCFKDAWERAGTLLAAKSVDILDRAKSAISAYFWYLVEHPEFLRLMEWESLQGGRHARRFLPDFFALGMHQLEKILKDGVAAGIFRRDVDMRQLLISINGLCSAYLSRREILGFLWTEDMFSPRMLEQRLDHILELLFNGILQKNSST